MSAGVLPAARIAAILLPLSVLGAWRWALSAANPPAEPASPEEDGAETDPTTAPDPASAARAVSAAPDVAPALTPVGVLLVGNSQASSAVDGPTLAAHFEVPNIKRKIVGGGFGPMIYASLKAEVFEAGLRPRWIVLVASVRHLLNREPPHGGFATLLRAPSVASDPAIQRKVYGQEGAAIPRSALPEEAEGLRDRILRGMAVLPLRLAGEPEPDARLMAARATVFERGDEALAVRRVAVIGGLPEAPTAAPAPPSSVEESLIPDILALCAEYGARLVIATHPSRSQELWSTPADTASVARAVEAAGSRFVALDSVPIPLDGWSDPGHLNAAGRAIFTRALVEALSGAPATEAPPALTPSAVEREGPDPLVAGPVRLTKHPCYWIVPVPAAAALGDTGLAALGLGWSSPVEARFGDGPPLRAHRSVSGKTGCIGQIWHGGGQLFVAPPEGAKVEDLRVSWTSRVPHTRGWPGSATEHEDAWWVPAGGALDIRWDQRPFDGAGHLALVAGSADAEGPPPRLEVGDAAVTLTRWGHLWIGSLPTAFGAPWKLRITSPSAHLFLRSLAAIPDADCLAHADAPEGEAAPEAASPTGAAVSLIGSPVDHGGRLELIPGGTIRSMVGAPVVRRWSRAEGEPASFTPTGSDAAISLTAARAMGAEGWLSGCPPLQPRAKDGTLGKASMAGPNRLVVASGAGEELVYVPGRVCARGVWVAPEDTLSLTTGGNPEIQAPAARLRASMWSFPLGGDVRVVLRVDGVVHLDASVPAEALESTTELRLDTPIQPGFKRLELLVTPPADTWTVVRATTLLAEAPAAGWFLEI